MKLATLLHEQQESCVGSMSSSEFAVRSNGPDWIDFKD